ncbi:MAG: RNA-binding domain-containing protein [Candidatus Geothermarchaeota archaeon]
MIDGTIAIILHATESKNKVLSSIVNNLNIIIKEDKLIVKEMKGHHGNPLYYCIIKISEKEAISILRKIKQSLSDTHKLLNEIDEYFEGSTLHLRLNKQKMCENIVELGGEDVLKITLNNITKEAILKILGAPKEYGSSYEKDFSNLTQK